MGKMAGTSAGPEQLRRLLDAVMSLSSDLELPDVLRNLTETAVELVGARYGALGVLNDERTSLADFITVGIDGATIAEIGELPSGHGILGLLILEPKPLRLPDLHEHPDSFGFPPGHPPMTSFLGVPVLVRGLAYGNLYLTDKENGEVFTDVDVELTVALAAATAIAIEKAWLHRRVRELDVIEDRDRIARDLHDTVIQRLFSTGLTLQVAARLAQPMPDVVVRIEQAVDELDHVVREVRSSIFELHAADAPADGVRRQLISLGDEMSDALGYLPTYHFEGPIDAAVSDEVAAHLVAIVGEALTNVARHAGSPVASVDIRVERDELIAVIEDHGVGPGTRSSGGHGLANLAQRAERLGGRSTIEDRLGGGTRVVWSVPLI